MGSQLQVSALPDRLRMGEALELFVAISPGGPPWRRLLEEWGLADSQHTAFANLSGGQRQRHHRRPGHPLHGRRVIR